jgi:hypothetical protein
MEEWESLESMGFPGYELSNAGEVRNERTSRVLKTSANQEGIVRVGLMKREEGRQVTVSLIRLVARMFVRGRSASFDTPIQLNGDRNDCSHKNLMWRPRWFAVKYFNQLENTTEPLMKTMIFDVETSKRYEDTREAAVDNGLLEEDIMKSVVNGSPCFPTWQIFARVSL